MRHDDNLVALVTRLLQIIHDLVDAWSIYLRAITVGLQPVIAECIHGEPTTGGNLLEFILGQGLLWQSGIGVPDVWTDTNDIAPFFLEFAFRKSIVETQLQMLQQ